MKNQLYALTLATLFLLPGCKWFKCCDHDHSLPVATRTATAHGVTEINSAEDFTSKVLKATKPVVVDFSAAWCGACQQIKPSIKALAQEHPQYDFVEVNVDNASSVANDYNIKGIPAILFFHNGKTVPGSTPVSGTHSKEALLEAIQAAFSSIKN